MFDQLSGNIPPFAAADLRVYKVAGVPSTIVSWSRHQRQPRSVVINSTSASGGWLEVKTLFARSQDLVDATTADEDFALAWLRWQAARQMSGSKTPFHLGISAGAIRDLSVTLTGPKEAPVDLPSRVESWEFGWHVAMGVGGLTCLSAYGVSDVPAVLTLHRASWDDPA